MESLTFVPIQAVSFLLSGLVLIVIRKFLLLKPRQFWAVFPVIILMFHSIVFYGLTLIERVFRLGFVSAQLYTDWTLVLRLHILITVVSIAIYIYSQAKRDIVGAKRIEGNGSNSI
jgi:hypothetical protein